MQIIKCVGTMSICGQAYQETLAICSMAGDLEIWTFCLDGWDAFDNGSIYDVVYKGNKDFSGKVKAEKSLSKRTFFGTTM